MKRFQSRLESLQRIREQAEKLARLEAGARRQEVSQLNQELATIQARIAETQVKGAALVAEGVVEALQMTAMTTARLQISEQATMGRKQESEQRLNEALQLVAAAQRDLEIVETKIETERTEHRREALTEEENDRQERASIRYHGMK